MMIVAMLRNYQKIYWRKRKKEMRWSMLSGVLSVVDKVNKTGWRLLLVSGCGVFQEQGSSELRAKITTDTNCGVSVCRWHTTMEQAQMHGTGIDIHMQV